MAVFERFPIWELKVGRSTQMRPEQYGFEKSAVLVLHRRIRAYIDAKNKEQSPSEQRRFELSFGPDNSTTIKAIKQALLNADFDRISRVPMHEYITVRRLI